MTTLRIIVIAYFFCLSTAATANVATSAVTEVLNLRVGLIPGRTRVVFDLSEPANYTVSQLQNPERVILELQAANSTLNHEQLSREQLALRGSHIESIEQGNMPEQSLRYVFNIAGNIEPRAFPLKPYLDHGHRLVLDLYIPEWAEDLESAAQSQPAVTIAANTAINTATQRTPVRTPQNATSIPNPVNSGASGHWSGHISLDSRLFAEDASYPEQDNQNASVALQPEYYMDWDQDRQRIAFRPFFRFDANDSERTHVDIRELYWRIEHQKIVFKAGVDVVFWGVTESRHLVDIINQTDSVENIDGEDKLGQPMLNVDYMSDSWGTWQAYVLPYFRERTFPGEQGRLRSQRVVNTNDPLYDSNDEEKHVDYAVRWSHYVGDWDIGLAHFSGTSRDPLFIPSTDNGREGLTPLYVQIDQTSLDVQATKGAWLWKLEAIYNNNPLEDYYATVGGFEFTQFGVGESAADLGWLLEYHYDELGDDALTPFQNDVFAGLRYTGNDIAGTRLLAGVIVDTDSQSTFGNVEAVRRLGESWTITVEARLFSNFDPDEPLEALEQDDYIEFQLSRYF